jgi:uncharacterized protein YjbI with pentapeptide repeats
MPRINFEDQDEFYEQIFEGLAFDSQAIEGISFYDCTFQECSFRESILRSCKFNNCHFKNCDLALANVEASVFSCVHFGYCQLIGINWAQANLPTKRLHKPFDFHNCVLNYSVFLGLNLKGVEIIRCIAKGVDFSDANLSEANCQHSDFKESRFANTDLSQADFCHASSYQIDAAANKLKKTRFMLPEALSLLHSLDIELVE